MRGREPEEQQGFGGGRSATASVNRFSPCADVGGDRMYERSASEATSDNGFGGEQPARLVAMGAGESCVEDGRRQS